MKQQQAMMELYKKEKINPIAGCLPDRLIQIPVFFALYTRCSSITIEMRHAPFFGWIKDLSAPDPTNDLQSVRAHSVPIRRICRWSARYFDARRLADRHGHYDVGADEAQPAAAGSDPADDL